MPPPNPIYTSDNCQMAYQLNWSVTAFPRVALPRPDTWIEELKSATEADGVRILEFRARSANAIQMFVSTQPHLSPAAIVASLKGRLQYLVRHQTPKAFRRNYRIDSVGDANTETLGRYVGKQTERHPMADHRLQQCLEKLQFHDPNVDLNGVQTSSSGQFIHNLHGVIENSDGWHEWREQVLTDSRDMILRSSRAKKFRLSRIGLVSNHIHVTLGCGISDDPQTVALGFLNNLAFVQEMRPVFKFSYYIGTFGNYDRQAIRRQLGGA